MSYNFLLVSILILYTQISNATDCSVTVPDNSHIILDSLIYHDLNNPFRAVTIPGWTLLDVDMMVYTFMGTQVGLD